jgi:uncharacterized membrane protein YedE/YeeE
VVHPKAEHPGNIVGGILFGIGWSVTGMCPGPIFVNIGEGKLYALAALAGVLAGTAAFGVLYGKLMGPLRMPMLDTSSSGGARSVAKLAGGR